MNRLFTILCMVSLLVFHTSCNDSVMDLESPIVEMNTHAVDQRVQNLIQQARQGDVEAYNSLALCYRDGDGVEKSWLNMICMYATYCKKTGNDIDQVIELFEEGHPFRIFTDILNSSTQNDEFMEKLDVLKQNAPAEVKAIKAAYELDSREDSEMVLNTLREAEDEGSELAALFQIVYFEEKGMKDDYEQCLIRLAEKFPVFNLKFGELNVEKYWESKDFSDIQKAIEYYYKADAYAMLTPRYASGLINMYNHFGEKGLLNCDEQEMERLKKIANIKD